MKFTFLLILLVPCYLFSQSGGKGFTITGKLDGLTENSQVTVSDVNKPSDTLARSVVSNGSFVLKGKVGEPNLVNINFNSAKKKAMLFLGNETVSVKGDTANVQQLEVKGSAFHNDFIQFQNTFNPLFQKLSEMNQKISATPNIRREDSLMTAYFDQFKKIQTSIDKFVAEKKSSPLSAFLLAVTSELEQDPSVIEKRLNSIDPIYRNGFYGKIVKQQVDDSKIGTIGSEAISFTQNDTIGKPVSLSSFRGKYVLIDFWASWCKPCRMENPNVVTAYHKFKSKNFTILGVSLDRAREPWIQAINDDKLAWTQVSDLKFWQNEVAMKYKVQGIPQNFLIDPDGKIVGKNLRGPALESKLCELLGCN